MSRAVSYTAITRYTVERASEDLKCDSVAVNRALPPPPFAITARIGPPERSTTHNVERSREAAHTHAHTHGRRARDGREGRFLFV